MALGPNESLIGKDGVAGELATPALILDLDAFEANLRTMADLAKRAGRHLRPHVKAHKSPAVGRRQIETGAVGLCSATVKEAEAMAEAGLDGILVTTPVVTPSLLSRLARAREKVESLMVAVDSDVGIDGLAAAASRRRPIDVLVDIDVGQQRTGVTEPAEAVRLARRAAELPQLRFLGLQAYYGHLQGVPTLAERREKVAEKWERVAEFLDALKAAGLEAKIVSGGGTGTHHLDLEGSPYTEIQPGSYAVMDKQYGAIELAPEGSPFGTALMIATRVVSANQPGRVIVDAGFKAMATDAGPALVASGAEGATYQFMGDEHGGLNFAGSATRPKVGDLVMLVAPHCDPTVNLHDWFHVMRGDRLVDIWPITARGY